MKITNIEELKQKANDIRIGIIEAVHGAKSGHPGGSLSCTDILAVLYFNQMQIDPGKSRDEARELIGENSKKLKKERAEKISKYKEDKFKAVSDEREDMRNSALSAKETLKDSVVDIAKNISLKILGDTIDISSIDKSQIQEQQGK